MAIKKKEPDGTGAVVSKRKTAGMSVKGYEENRNQKYTTKYRAGITGEEKAKSESRIANKMWKEVDDGAKKNASNRVRANAPLKQMQENNRMFSSGSDGSEFSSARMRNNAKKQEPVGPWKYTSEHRQLTKARKKK